MNSKEFESVPSGVTEAPCCIGLRDSINMLEYAREYTMSSKRID